VVAGDAPSAAAALRLSRARKLMTGGAIAIVTGVALVGTVSRDVGGVVLIAAWIVMVAAIHMFGRS
jgi:hypothetical protein